MSTTTKQIRHPEFAQRMAQACDGNMDVPPLNYGRLGWFVDQLDKKFNETCTIETVRRWFSGESRPREKTMRQLAAILKVDESWLSIGQNPAMTQKERRARNYNADGAVNLLAGLVQMSGWNPAFPEDEAGAVDLEAIIRGASYKFHVVTGEKVGDDWIFHVPFKALDCVVVGVVRDAEFTFRFFELDKESVETVGKRKSGVYEVSLSAHDWNQIQSFDDRI